MEKSIKFIEHAVMLAAGICMVAIMILVSLDALLRYSINSPIPWSYDLVTYYLIIIAVYFALSSSFKSGDQINIDLIKSILPKPVQIASAVVYTFMALAVFVIIAHGAITNTIDAYHDNDFLPGFVTWPAWASHLPIAIGASVLCLRLLVHGITLITTRQNPLDQANPEDW